MGKVGTVLAFVVASAVALMAFAPVGAALAETAYDVFGSMIDGGSSEATAALVPLVVTDVALLVIAFVISLLGGVKLPSGLPHVFFALAIPFTLGAMQQRFFELAGNVGGIADTFGAANFVAMFLLSIVVAQLGVHLARWRHEAREATLATEV